MKREGRRTDAETNEQGTYLRKPAPHIIPSYAHDMPSLETSATRVVTRTIKQQSTIAEAEVFHERLVTDLYFDLGDGRFAGVVVLDGLVTTHEAFIAFADNPGLATPVTEDVC
jgi:hypothetical protein